MREIKFRVWDSAYEKFIYSEFLELNSEGEVVSVFDNGRDVEDYEENKDASISQYTGLKDKNGRDIYEGDIIDFNWTEDKDRGVAEFVDGCFKITKMKRHTSIPLFLRYPTHEVIGNIYENPELLEVTP
jgi:uncharacterized phage protein (TIGR01671 family)